MHPIHDSDVLLLLSTAMAAKRKPATLAQIVTALDILHGSLLSPARFVETLQRLAAHGLMQQVGEGFALTAAALEMMTTQSRRSTPAENIFRMKEQLATYQPAAGTGGAVAVSIEDVEAAIKSHRTAAQGAGKNLLMPVRSKETDNKRAAPRGRPTTARRPTGK